MALAELADAEECRPEDRSEVLPPPSDRTPTGDGPEVQPREGTDAGPSGAGTDAGPDLKSDVEPNVTARLQQENDRLRHAYMHLVKAKNITPADESRKGLSSPMNCSLIDRYSSPRTHHMHAGFRKVTDQGEM